MKDLDLSPYAIAVPGAVLVMIYALLNGVPFAYPDSFVYLAYGDTAWQRIGGVLRDLLPPDGAAAPGSVPGSGASIGIREPAGPPDPGWTPSAGRSFYYGALSGLPGPLAAPWNGILLQGYCGALAVALAWRALAGSVGIAYLAAMGLAGLLTTFGIFAATVMPDVWAAIGLLALVSLAAFRGRRARIDGFVLWSFVLVAALFHSTHLAALGAIAVLCAAARLAGATTLGWRTIGAMAAMFVVAVALTFGARVAIERMAGAPSLGKPFLTAHLIDGGPGMDFVRDACPGAAFAICERADRLPVDWRTFLFAFSADSEAYERRLAVEDRSFALATLRHAPGAVLALALRDAVRQVGMIGLVTTPIRADIGERIAAETTTLAFGRRVLSGRLYDATWLYAAVSGINAGLVLAGIAALSVLALRPSRIRVDMRRVVVVGAAGLLSNAAICGVLASPYDRFQARVAWLIPVLAAMGLAAWLRTRNLERDPYVG